MKEYWQERYLKDGKIWGNAPSKTAEYALKLFREKNVKKILVPGAGYGRNSRLFSDNKFNFLWLSKESDAASVVDNTSILNFLYSVLGRYSGD